MEEEVHIIYVDPPKKKKTGGGSILKKVILFLGVVFAFLALTSVVIAAFFEEEIGEKLLSEINKQIESDLEVGNFELSLLAGFPNVSARLNNVTLKDNGKGNLIEAEEIAFKIGLLSLFSSNINIKSVKISDGAVYIKKVEEEPLYQTQGHVNFTWKTKWVPLMIRALQRSSKVKSIYST